MIQKAQKIVDYEKTQVVFNELTEGLIKRYLKTYEYWIKQEHTEFKDTENYWLKKYMGATIM